MKEKLEKLLNNSYSPYSNFKVSCIVECENGMYEGVNVENASYGATMCAERNAIAAAITNGEKKFKALYLMSTSEKLIVPCNICKQVFLEFMDKDTLFNIMNKNGDMKVYTFDEIMKEYFTKEDLQ